MKESTNSVQSLERAFDLLSAISKSDSGLQLNELVSITGLHKSTAYRLVGALVDMGYVKKNDLKYTLSYKIFELAGSVVDRLDVADVAAPFLEELCNISEETVHLVIQDGSNIVYVRKRESQTNSIRLVSSIGMRRPMFCTAVGKSILANRSYETVEDIWKKSNITKYTDHTVTDFNQFLTELELIRKRGYAIDNEENELGVRCISSSIRSFSGKCRSAFSVSGPISRMTDEKIEILIPLVKQASKEISASMGYHGEV